METKKIAIACFIGGALCCAIALVFAPVYWWFGLIAGFAGGYISYEFREVQRAIPIALRATWKGSACVWENTITKALKWFSVPHPFLFPSVVIVVSFWVWKIDPVDWSKFVALNIDLKAMAVSMIAVSSFVMVSITVMPIAFLAFIGAEYGEHCCWDSDMMLGEHEYTREPPTYRNVARWVAKGFGLCILFSIRFFAWTIWKYLPIATWAMLCFLGRFAWNLFKLIHSEKRVLCAIDGTLGGAVSYLWFSSISMSFMEQAVLVIFGGFLGAAFGVANWEIVSKRILHMSIDNTSA